MLWIRHAEFVVTVDESRRIIRDGSVVVSGSTILDLGKDADMSSKYADRLDPKDIIDASGSVVLPGFIDTHAHVFDHLSRGLFPDDLATRPWVYNCFFPFQAVLTEEEAYISAQFACIDMMKTGTTCFIEGHVPVSNSHLDAAWQAIEDTGMRAILGRQLCDKRPADLPAFWKPEWRDAIFARSTAQAIAEMKDVLKRGSSRPSGRVRVWAGINGWLSLCSDELFVEAKRLADEYNVGTAYHIATFIDEARETQAVHGSWPITYLDRLGAIGENVVLIHAIAVNDAEVQLLAQRRAKIAHCPGTALKLAKGASQYGKFPEMLAQGVTVSLGADGVCSSGTFDMTRQMGFAAGLFKDARMDPRLVPAEVALEMATINGARAALWDAEIGSLEIGKKADLVIFDTRRPEWLPLHDVVRNLVYSANGSSVTTVVIDGRVTLRDGKVVTVNEGDILSRGCEAAERIRLRAGLDPTPRWPTL